jgi:hypothetical protein
MESRRTPKKGTGPSSDKAVSPKDQHNMDQAFVFRDPLQDFDSSSPVAFEYIINKNVSKNKPNLDK